MTTNVHLACGLCGEEFVVPAYVYDDLSGVVYCPLCGSTELILLVVQEPGPHELRDAAA